MNMLDDQLANAAEEARHNVATTRSRPVAAVQGRQQRRRAAFGTMIVAGILGLSGLSAFIAQDPAGMVVATSDSPSTSIAQPTGTPESATTQNDSLRFYEENDDELRWDWTAQVAALRTDSNTTVHELNGLQQKLATVADTVPAIGNATVLMFESNEFQEEAFFVLEDGTDTMVYIGWQEYDGDRSEDIHIRIPVIDERFGVGLTDDVLVAHNVTEHVVDFVADAGTQVVTVRFFQLSDTYGSLPLIGRPDPMNAVFVGVLAALDLPADSAGNLFDGADKGILPRPPLPAAIPSDLVTSQMTVTEAPAIYVCGNTPNTGETLENGATLATPTDALWGFLKESVSIETRPGFLTSGYTQMELPDGSIAFANLFEDAPTQSVTTVYIAPTDGAWTVTGWEASGC